MDIRFMARYEHVRIFQLSYEITMRTYKITSNFKKEYKYTLGEKLKLLCHEILDLIVEANSNKDKKELLLKLNFKMESLRIYFRVAGDLKLISFGLIGEMNRLFNEIGQQVAGWQKWAEQNAKSTPARVFES